MKTVIRSWETLKREKQDAPLTAINCSPAGMWTYQHITGVPLTLKADFLIIRIKKINSKVKILEQERKKRKRLILLEATHSTAGK